LFVHEGTNNVGGHLRSDSFVNNLVSVVNVDNVVGIKSVHQSELVVVETNIRDLEAALTNTVVVEVLALEHFNLKVFEKVTVLKIGADVCVLGLELSIIKVIKVTHESFNIVDSILGENFEETVSKEEPLVNDFLREFENAEGKNLLRGQSEQVRVKVTVEGNGKVCSWVECNQRPSCESPDTAALTDGNAFKHVGLGHVVVTVDDVLVVNTSH